MEQIKTEAVRPKQATPFYIDLIEAPKVESSPVELEYPKDLFILAEAITRQTYEFFDKFPYFLLFRCRHKKQGFDYLYFYAPWCVFVSKVKRTKDNKNYIIKDKE